MLSAERRKKMWTTNGIERPIQHEFKRRTRNPNSDSLLRLASAILVEIDDEWSTSTKRYITSQDSMARRPFANLQTRDCTIARLGRD